MDQKQPKILVIEDERLVATAIKAKLERNGFDVTLALDGRSGLGIALGSHPDLILLDMVLPAMDGLTVLKRLREDEWGKGVPVIILSNLTTEENIKKSRQGGVSDYLLKTDWRLEDVVKRIKKELNK